MLSTWKLLQLTTRQILTAIIRARGQSHETLFSAIQCGSTIQTLPSQSNVYDLLTKILTMVPIGGKQNLSEGLHIYRSLLSGIPKPDCKLIFLLTNGDHVDGSAFSIATQLVQEGVSIISVGIGENVEQSNIDLLAQDIHYSFVIKNADQLKATFTPTLVVTPPWLKQPKLEKHRARVSKAEVLLEFNHPGVVSATLEKHDGNQWTQVHTRQIPNNTDVSTRLVATKLKENEEYDFRAIVELEGGHKVKSNVITIKTRKANVRGKLLSNREELLKMNEKYTKKIIDFCSDLKQDVNIGLVGKIGNGKSAAVNSIWSIFNEKFQIQSIVGYMGETCMTSRPLRIPIPKTKIQVVDFFGWNNPEQYASDLRYFIEGLAPDDFTDGQALRPGFRPVLEGTDKRKLYGVFILISPQEVAQANHFAYVQVLYDYINRLGLQPIILLTKCDQIDTELVDHPEYIYDSDLVDNYITMLEEKKFLRGFIYPVVSYYEPPEGGELDPVRNYLFLSALHTLLCYNMAHSISHLRQK